MEIRLDDHAGHHDDAHARPRLRAGRRVLLHRRSAGRAPVDRRALLRHRLGGRHRVQRGHRRDGRRWRRCRRRGSPRPRRRAGCAASTSLDELRRPARRRSPTVDADRARRAGGRARAGAARAGAVRRDRRGARRRRVRPRRASRSSCARTSAATTPSTRWSAGCCSTARLPAAGLGLFVSGRASFEIVQKAWAAGFSAVVAVERAVVAGGRHRPARPAHAGRLRARRPDERLRPEHVSPTHGAAPSHRRVRPDALGQLAPNGIGQQKPNHYREMAKVAWANRAPPEVRVGRAHQGRVRRVRARRRRLPRLDASTACTSARPGCGCSRSTRPTPFDHDRARPTSTPLRRRSASRAARRSAGSAHPMRRRRGEPGFRRIAWDEALDALAGAIAAAGGDRTAHLPHEPRHHQRGVLRRPARRPGPWASPASTRPPGCATRRPPSGSSRRSAWPPSTCSLQDVHRERPRRASGAPTRPTTSRCS